jgi:hypothetical protein
MAWNTVLQSGGHCQQITGNIRKQPLQPTQNHRRGTAAVLFDNYEQSPDIISECIAGVP